MFKTLYNELDARVLLNGQCSNPFPILRSVKQGDALSCILFILCIETLTSNIENDLSISNPPLPNCFLPKTFSYADDVALVVRESCDIQRVFDRYSEFSSVSGLFLNFEKTEILNLIRYTPDEHFTITSSGGSEVVVSAVESLVLCRKTFSLNENVELYGNVVSKIEKLESGSLSMEKETFKYLWSHIGTKNL